MSGDNWKPFKLDTEMGFLNNINTSEIWINTAKNQRRKIRTIKLFQMSKHSRFQEMPVFGSGSDWYCGITLEAFARMNNISPILSTR
ncbi:hypothetical protein BMS3Abin15_00539 [bacterium BMS3Abin15]|nr:hypothetical protein BMS3Abin15_00539 [bacterium BMS3Abin15]HDZ86020.1 hypothetical protein [Candidatus Moranbacteria bacterium]